MTENLTLMFKTTEAGRSPLSSDDEAPALRKTPGIRKAMRQAGADIRVDWLEREVERLNKELNANRIKHAGQVQQLTNKINELDRRLSALIRTLSEWTNT